MKLTIHNPNAINCVRLIDNYTQQTIWVEEINDKLYLIKAIVGTLPFVDEIKVTIQRQSTFGTKLYLVKVVKEGTIVGRYHKQSKDISMSWIKELIDEAVV